MLKVITKSPLNLIHFGLCFGPIPMLLIPLILRNDPIPNELFKILGITLAAVLGAASFLILKHFARPSESKEIQMQKYYNAKIMQWGLVESAALLNCTLHFVSKNPENAIASLALIALLITLFPRESERDRLFPVPRDLNQSGHTPEDLERFG